MSGDEFVIFLYGYDSKDEIREICEQIQQGMHNTTMRLPDYGKVQVRASAGLAWYPDDSQDYHQLIRYADFTMYFIKHTNKGRFNEFNIESYNKEAYLLHCREELNIIIDEELVDYQFQPIVDARTGEIFAFEALMRPKTPNIQNPAELLTLARSQSKLSAIERLTWFRCLECFDHLPIAQSNCKLFVNSIANQVLRSQDQAKLEEQYGRYLNRLVVELTEEDRVDVCSEPIREKQSMIHRWNAQMALDDFGVGYNGEAKLVDLSPGYVKLDMSIIRNVHLDENRRILLKNLIPYCKERGIKIIAEGVELREEMEVLIAFGVDYLQGYYLGKPTYQPMPELPERREEILKIQKR